VGGGSPENRQGCLSAGRQLTAPAYSKQSDFFFQDESRRRRSGVEEYLGPKWTRIHGGHQELTGILGGWSQMKANDMGWLTFNGRFVNYPRFKRE
jgi:hypothetical protein